MNEFEDLTGYKDVTYYIPTEALYEVDFKWRQDAGMPLGVVEGSDNNGSCYVHLRVSDEQAAFLAIRHTDITILPATNPD